MSNYIPINASNANTVSTVPRQEHMKALGGALVPYLQRLYSIFLWDMNSGEVLAAPNLDPSGTRTNAEYFFDPAPRSHEVTDPFTTKVIATQNGGRFIESHGSLFKDIRVQGTTGLRPKKKAKSVIPLFTTEPFEVLAGSEFRDRGIPSDEVTGYDDIHFLRNIFRHYSDLKGRNSKVVMVWRNIKDDDYWVVEPRDFKLVLSSKSPLTYEYQINLQGVTRFNGNATVTIPPDPQRAFREITQANSRINSYQQALTNSFMMISTNITRIQAAGYSATSTILGPLTDTLKGLTAIGQAGSSTAAGLLRVVDTGLVNFTDAYDKLVEQLDEADEDDLNMRKLRSPVLREFLRTIIIFSRIKSERALVNSAANAAEEAASRSNGAYTEVSGGLSGTLRAPPGTDVVSPSRNVAEDVVHVGESITDIARRLTGSASNWKDIVLINGLRSPYVSSDTTLGDDVLNPGDPVLYPSSAASSNLSSYSVNPVDGESTRANTVLSQTYGRDIRLKTVSGGSVDLTDLAINQRRDIATIIGIDNVEQAVKIKFATEQGSLPAHPTFGAQFPIGHKNDISSFNTFSINTRATLLSDTRISSISKLDFVSVGDVLAVSAVCSLVDSRDYLSTNFALRKF